MLNNNDNVGKVAAMVPQSQEVFKKLGVDFCCGGKMLLKDALAEKNTTIEEFEVFLRNEQDRRKGEQGTDYLDMSAPVLTTYIEDTHHVYVRNALPEIAELLSTVLRVHGKNHRELFEVYNLFGKLKTDLEQHLVKEETMLFPALSVAISENETASLAAEIIAEHEAAGRLLDELHRVTSDFALPDDACESYKNVYAIIKDLEDDLHQHIHLENNILLKQYYFLPA